MRLIATADLHFNHPKSQVLAEQCIQQMNQTGGDVLLVVGDTAVADGNTLEQCLSMFEFTGPKLFVAGNHELWTSGPDSYELFTTTLPARVRALGWHWLQTEPFVAGASAIVGSIGWYDYSFAAKSLGIPKRFYAAKTSPGAAELLGGPALLLENMADVSPRGREVVARWNDGKFVKLGRSDEQFLQELLDQLESQLSALTDKSHIVAAIHHLPFRALLPPSGNAQWDFTKAFLGSDRIGKMLMRYQNVRQVLCGHSHTPAEARVEQIHAINIGSGYRFKTFRVLDLPD